jgi:sugar-specific transcriptional regulator TrmB
MLNIDSILRSLGFAESEQKTYLAALENGSSTVLELSKLTHLSRQATYTAIETLTKLGLMSSMVTGKKRYYSAGPPERLLDYAKRRETEVAEHVASLERALPELALRIGGERPVVKVYEGAEGIRTVVDEMQRSKVRESFEISDLDAMYAILKPEELEPMRTKIKKVGIHVHGLYAGVASPKVADSERHALPKEFSNFKSNITIYGNKIALVTFEGKMHSVIIESAALAQTLIILFRLALKTAKQFPEM